MDGESRRENSKRASGGLEAPACVQVYVWVFMVTFSVSPTLCLLLVHDGIDRGNGLESLVIIGLIQAALWTTQRRCSSEDLSYWDGLLVAAASGMRRVVNTYVCYVPPALRAAIQRSIAGRTLARIR